MAPTPEPLARNVCSFLSDYGLADEFVGVCKAVMLQRAPALQIIDISHDVPPFDVRAGALTLVRAVQYLPAGIVLAIVDPGVGTSRRCVAVEVEHGCMVGPDNGLLAPSVALLGGAARAVELTNPDYQLESPGPTFAGRDVMAPAAGALAAGIPLDEFGPAVDPAGLVPAVLPLPQTDDDGRVAGEVLWVDRFGNCQLNVDADGLAERGLGPGASLELRVGTEGTRARWVRTFADARPSEPVLLVDSYGLLALCLDRASAASAFGLHAGSTVVVVPPGAGEPGDSSRPDSVAVTWKQRGR